MVFIFLNAYSFESYFLFTLKTVANAPSPILARNSNFSDILSKNYVNVKYMNKILVFTNNQIINQIIIPLINVSKFNIWIKLCLIYMKCVAKICYIRDVLFII